MDALHTFVAFASRIDTTYGMTLVKGRRFCISCVLLYPATRYTGQEATDLIRN